MSCHVVIFENGVKMMRPVQDAAEYRALRGSERQQQLVDACRKGNDKAKTWLLQMCYSCMPNPDGRLKGSKTPSNSVGMDVDFDPAAPDYAAKMSMVPAMVLDKKDELGLLMMERSARKGFHIVFRRRKELSQEENLRWASDVLGVRYDEAAKDITRVFFTTTDSKEDLIFLEEELFCSEELGVRSEEYLPAEKAESSPLNYLGLEYSKIIRRYWEMFHEGKEPKEGNRNVLTFELAMLLRPICEYKQEVMEQVIPRYDGLEEDEWRKTIENALKEPRRGMPTRLKQVLNSLRDVKSVKAVAGTMAAPPPMPKKLPPLIRLLTQNVPDYYKPAVAAAVFPPLGAHMHGVKFTYWDNVQHEPTFMNVLVGRQSIGKGCINAPIDYIMADIKKRDEPNRRREAEWKRMNPSAKQKAKDPRPADICIQMVIDNLTDAVFNQRIVDANTNGERFVYTKVDEVEALRKVTSKGSTEEVTLLIRKAFDNALAGQERVGADSVSGIAPLRWNWNASTTPPNARRFFFKAVNNGTISRLDISTIIVDNDEPPVIGIYDQTFADELQPYIERLDSANGIVECPQAKKLALEMMEENSAMAEMMESDAYRVLSYRANVIAWLKGMLLYVAHGYKWSKEIESFVRWSLQYNLWCKMLFFGQQLERELQEENEIERQSGPQNMLLLLPEEFTKDEYLQLRTSLGKTGDGGSTLRSWVKRKYVEWDEIAGKFVNKKRGVIGE